MGRSDDGSECDEGGGDQHGGSWRVFGRVFVDVFEVEPGECLPVDGGEIDESPGYQATTDCAEFIVATEQDI